jgi:transcriptional regulator with XRE-family HTH domain
MKKTSTENLIFGQRLKALRIARKLKAEEVALLLGVAPSTYREWENGRAVTGQPYVEMANAFRVGIHELMGISDPRTKILCKLTEIEAIIQDIRTNF